MKSITVKTVCLAGITMSLMASSKQTSPQPKKNAIHAFLVAKHCKGNVSKTSVKKNVKNRRNK